MRTERPVSLHEINPCLVVPAFEFGLAVNQEIKDGVAMLTCSFVKGQSPLPGPVPAPAPEDRGLNARPVASDPADRILAGRHEVEQGGGLSTHGVTHVVPSAVPLGKHFYLFQKTPGQPSNVLIITAHGGYLPGIHTNVPENTKLVYYGPDGKSLADPGLENVINGGVNTYEEKTGGSRERNYFLSKYRSDSNEDVRLHVSGSDVDVLTVRKRYAPGLFLKNAAISLSDVFVELKKGGIQYDEVHCLICRNHVLDLVSGSYVAEKNNSCGGVV